jgi:uncharacterized membrane protein
MARKGMNLKIFALALVLTAMVFVAHTFTDITGIEKWSMANGTVGWLALFFVYLIFLIVPLYLLTKRWAK